MSESEPNSNPTLYPGQSDSSYIRWFKPHVDEELKMSANAARKAKTHGQRVIAMLYCIVLLSIGLSISLYCTTGAAAETKYSFVWFYTMLYLTSIIAMLYMMAYIWTNRNASMEAVEAGDLSAPRILFSMRGEPVSLYLRIGLCIFALMAIVFTASRAREAMLQGAEFHQVIPYIGSKILFFAVQPIFLLLLHRLVVLSDVRRFSFLLLHLVTVSLCVWVESVVDKISRTMDSHSPTNNTTAHTQTTSIDQHIAQASAYFLPAIPEYCAISAAVIYEMSQRIGQLKQIEAHHERLQTTHKKWTVKKHGSILLGAFILLIILLIILILEAGRSLVRDIRTIIHMCEVSTIQIIALFLCIFGVILVRRLKFSVNFAKNSLDEKLLMVTFFFTVNFFCVAFVLCVGYLLTGKLSPTYQAHVAAQLVTVFLELVQVIAQTYFIHDMFYRCCHHESYQEKKPGRAAIVILASLNFSLWMIYSFQFKHNGVFFRSALKPLQNSDIRALNIFISATLPMVMLFRYHSSVCLAISYSRVYEDEVTRYENMLRWVKQDANKDFLHKQKNSLANIWSTVDLSSPKLTEQNQEVCANGRRHVQLLTSSDTDVNELRSAQPRKRRDTKVNIEMARIRLAASEASHRQTELKLKQQRMKERMCAQSIRDIIEEGAQDSTEDVENVSRN